MKNPVEYTPVEAGQRRQEVRDLLRQRLKTRELPEPKVRLDEKLPWDVMLQDFDSVKGDKQKAYQKMAGLLHVAGYVILNGSKLAPADGLMLADSLSKRAAKDLEDFELAEGIVDGWLAPYLDKGNPDTSYAGSRFDIAKGCLATYNLGGKWEKTLLIAPNALALAEWDSTRDLVRLRMLDAYCNLGDFVRAYQLLPEFEESGLSEQYREVVRKLEREHLKGKQP